MKFSANIGDSLRGSGSSSALALLSVCPAILYLAVLVVHLQTQWWNMDFAAYYCWAYALRTGLDPYTVWTPLASKFGLAARTYHANYPATFIFLFEPLTLVSPKNAYAIWTSFNVFLLLISLLILLARSGLGLRGCAIFATLAIFYEPISEDFFWGQLQVVLLFILVLNFRWACTGRDIAAGLALALAILLKAFPAILLLHFVLARRLRVVAWTILGIAFGAGLTVLVVGPKAFGFLRAGSTIPKSYWNAGLSVNATISQLFSAIVPEPFSKPVNLARIALIVAAIVWALALGAKATIHSAQVGREQDAYGLWVVLSVFIFPITWIHHMALLLIPLAQIAFSVHKSTTIGPIRNFGFASYALAETMLPMFWAYWLTWFVPLLTVTSVIARISGAFAFWAGYRLACPAKPATAP